MIVILITSLVASFYISAGNICESSEYAVLNLCFE